MTARSSAVLLALVLVSGSAVATETEADALFRMGREAMQRNDPATACRLFTESYALDAAAGTLLNIGRCEEALGRIASASKRYQKVMAESDPGSDRHAYAKKRHEALAPRLPRLTLRLPAAAGTAAVSLDGTVVSAAELGAAIAVDPGKHVIEVRREDGVTKSYDVTLAEAEQRELEVAPAPLAAPAPATSAAATAPPPGPPPAPIAPTNGPPRDAPRAEADTTLAWVLLGTGAAGLVLSGVAALVVLDRKAVVEEECNEDLVCRSQTGKDAADTGQTWSTIGTVAFIVGAASAGAGTYLLLTAEPQKNSAFVGVRAAF